MPIRADFKTKMIEICDERIAKKSEVVGLSFYAFFSNKNTNPELLIEVAHWWIIEQKLDHFEKAVRIKQLIGQ